MSIQDHIRIIRTSYEVNNVQYDCLLVKGTPRKLIQGPHRAGGISHLTMGDYRNYTHTELYPVKFEDGHVRIHQCTVHNDHVSDGSCSYPYTGNLLHIPPADQATVKALIDNLISEL